MSNLRKQAFNRFKEIKSQKIGNTIITTPTIKETPLKPRRRTDEIYADMMDRFYEDVEAKMIDLSRWNGEGNLYQYRDYEDAEYYRN